MAPLNYPTPGRVTLWITLWWCIWGIQSQKRDVHLVVETSKQLVHISIVVAVIEADVVPALGPWQRYRLQNIYKLCLIVLVGRAYGR